MIIKNLLTKSRKELLNLNRDLRAELFMLRFNNKIGKTNQPHKIAIIRKDIARILTTLQILEQREKQKNKQEKGK